MTEVQLYACPNGSVSFNGISIPVGSTQTFILMAANGCDSLVSVSALALPDVNFELAASASCWNKPDGTIQVSSVSGQEPYRYAIDGGGFQSTPSFAGLASGPHTILIEDANGCTATQNITVPQTSPIQVQWPDVSLSCELGEVILRPVVISSQPEDLIWRWQDGSDKPWLLVNEAGTYILSLDDGCEVSEHAIEVKWDEARLRRDWFYIPNCFSPNADGVNDKFQVFPGQDFEILSFEFRIFDRWGDALFMTADPAVGWNGIHRGIEMQPAVYGWYVIARLRLCGGRELDVFKKGGVTIVR